MILKGQKRKLDAEDADVSDPSSPLWESQRQFVFSVSLNKYQRSQELPEPSLRRSVLIANTLRQIALEERAVVAPEDAEESPSPTGEERESVDAESTPSSSSVDLGAAAATTEDHDEDWGSMSADSDFSLSTAISSILTALDSTMAAPRTPLRSLENLPGASACGKHGSRVCGGEAAAAAGYLSDVAMEELFQDVETSLLERDMGGLGIRSGQAEEELICCLPRFSPSSSSSPSLCLSLNSSLKCLPSFSSFSPLPSSTSPSSPESASFSGQNPAREGFDLMEILVES